ncbi:hypothetical protein BCD67_24830 [Oscillatoriales cyanobacterium USR001]|nr:hypothetical protein BCD67_24830 [Oscillatoriales cyanobacterium USR001]
MKITTKIPVIYYKDDWFETEGEIQFEWEVDNQKTKEGLIIVREEINETLKMLEADGEMLPELKQLTKAVKRKQQELEKLEEKLKKRTKKIKTLENALRQFGIEPDNFGVIMDLKKITYPALEAEVEEVKERTELFDDEEGEYEED